MILRKAFIFLEILRDFSRKFFIFPDLGVRNPLDRDFGKLIIPFYLNLMKYR